MPQHLALTACAGGAHTTQDAAEVQPFWGLAHSRHLLSIGPRVCGQFLILRHGTKEAFMELGTPRALTQHRAWLWGAQSVFATQNFNGVEASSGKLLASPHRNQCFLSLSHWSEEQMESPPTTRGRQGCRFGVMGEVSGGSRQILLPYHHRHVLKLLLPVTLLAQPPFGLLLINTNICANS